MVQCPSCSLGKLPDDTKRCPLCGFQGSAQRNQPPEKGRKDVTPASDPATRQRSSTGQGGAGGQRAPDAAGKRASSQALNEKNFAILQREMSDEFRIDPEFRRGKRSLVYRAQEVGSDRPVALKIVLTGGTVDDAVASRFREKAALVQALDHPQIVSLYKFGVTRRFFWYSMEYLEEQSLETILGGNFRVKRVGGALGIVAAVADALGYAYLSGVAHGDVKPSNIFVDKETGSRLSDFAMAGLFGRPGSPTAPSALRRPEYMAPEQFSSETVGQEVDQYALALVAFRCLVGRPPFTGKSFEEVARLHTSTPAPRVDELRPDVPPHVRDAIQRALSKAPEERFPDLSDFAGALTRSEEPTPVPAKKAPPTAVPTRTAEPTPALTKQVDAVTPPPQRQGSTPVLTIQKARTTAPVGAPTSTPRPLLQTRALHPARRRRRTIALAGMGILAVSAITALALLPRPPWAVSPPDEPAAAAPAPAEQVASGTEAIQPDLTPSGPVNTQGQEPPSRPTAAQQQPARTQPTRTPPARTQPTRTQPTRTQPVRTQPAQRQPARTQPVRTQPAQRQPVQTQPPRTPAAQAPPPAAPAPRPAAAAESGRLFLNATPWGVVYIDGKEMGNTPQMNLAVSAGSHVLRVVREGFQPFEREIEIAVDEVLRITDITLVPLQQ